MMTGGMVYGSLILSLLLLGFAYIVYVLANKESGGIKTAGQVIAIIIAVIALLVFLYSGIYGGVMGRGICGRGMMGMRGGYKGYGMMHDDKGRYEFMEKMMEKPGMMEWMEEYMEEHAK